jgi:hypothetical protein
MQSCTECGTPITPAIGPPVLNNGNVVCQPCWQKIGAEAQPQRPQVTSRRSVSSTGPTSSSRRQTSTTPAARRSTGTREEAPAAPRSTRGTSRRATPSAAEPAAERHRPTSRTAALIEEVESSTTGDRMKLYVIITMCVMIIIAAVVGFMWKSKTERDAAAARAATEASDAALLEVKRIIQTEPDNFDKQLDAIKTAEPKMEGFPAKKGELQTLQGDVTMKRDAFNTKKEAETLLAELTKEVEDPTKLEGVPLKLDRANKFGSSQGKEYLAKLKEIETRLTLNTLKRKVDAAKSKEAEGNAFDALSAYDDAVIQFNKYFDKTTTPEKPIVDLYKELLNESDKLVERTLTPEYEASVAERDLLSTKERGLWGSSEGVKHSFAGRELKLDGVPVEGKKILGVTSALPPRSTPWYDIALDLEFTILQEGFEMYLRFDQAKKNYRINFNPKEGYELNKPYRMTVRVKGSTITLKPADQAENRDRLDPSTSRQGGIGFGVPKNASVVISVCKVKVLRPKT